MLVSFSTKIDIGTGKIKTTNLTTLNFPHFIRVLKFLIFQLQIKPFMNNVKVRHIGSTMDLTIVNKRKKNKEIFTVALLCSNFILLYSSCACFERNIACTLTTDLSTRSSACFLLAWKKSSSVSLACV